jgi:hypothetical protein
MNKLFWFIVILFALGVIGGASQGNLPGQHNGSGPAGVSVTDG